MFQAEFIAILELLRSTIKLLFHRFNGLNIRMMSNNQDHQNLKSHFNRVVSIIKQ